MRISEAQLLPSAYIFELSPAHVELSQRTLYDLARLSCLESGIRPVEVHWRLRGQVVFRTKWEDLIGHIPVEDPFEAALKNPVFRLSGKVDIRKTARQYNIPVVEFEAFLEGQPAPISDPRFLVAIQNPVLSEAGLPMWGRTAEAHGIDVSGFNLWRHNFYPEFNDKENFSPLDVKQPMMSLKTKSRVGELELFKHAIQNPVIYKGKPHWSKTILEYDLTPWRFNRYRLYGHFS